MATNAREEFLKSDLYAELRQRAAGLTASDAEFVGEAVALILKILQGSGKGPFTMLLPTDEAFEKLPIDPDGEIPSEVRQGLLGILLDTFLYGTLLSDGIEDALRQQASVELMTVGGGVLRAMHQDGQLVLVDPNGCTAKVSGAVFKGPVTVCHHVDAVLMWEEWMGPNASEAGQWVKAGTP